MSNLADVNKEYEKDPKLKKEDIESLRIWAEKQPHLPKIEELQYILFLQSCYYSNEQAKSAIENYFTIRTLCRDIFSNGNVRDPALQMAFDIGLVRFLPTLAPSGYKVLYMRLLDFNPDKYIYVDQLRMFDTMVTRAMHQEGTCEGVHMVFDPQGALFSHMLKVSPVLARKFLVYLQEGLPIRLKDINIMNAPGWIDRALAIFKPLMKKELYDMIKVHTTPESFYKIVPQEMLPTECGGSAGSVKEMGEANLRDLIENEEFFKMQDKQLTDESKRTEKSKDINKIFGLEGTFKKLEVD